MGVLNEHRYLWGIQETEDMGEAILNPEKLLKSAIHFFPNPENKVMIQYELRELKKAIMNHYLKKGGDVESDMARHYESIGFLKTLWGRKVYPDTDKPILNQLCDESTYDTWNVFAHEFNCISTESKVWCICDREEITRIRKRCQDVIDTLHLRVPYQIEFKVIHNENIIAVD